MFVVTGPISMEPELLGERVFLVSGRSSLAGHPGRRNSHFKEGGSYVEHQRVDPRWWDFRPQGDVFM